MKKKRRQRAEIGWTTEGTSSVGHSPTRTNERQWEADQRKTKEFRGNFLSHAVIVEWYCEELLSLILFFNPRRLDAQRPKWLERAQVFFENYVLTKLRFEQKIAMIKNASETDPWRRNVHLATAASQLDTFRIRRNELAHCPISFETEYRGKRQVLVRYLETAKEKKPFSKDIEQKYRDDTDHLERLLAGLIRDFDGRSILPLTNH
jgi:hypothetical protein